uniref:Uncharacterized protein n=1 Tax=Arundo donax TaxID=35708 RepID=A0A0A9A094_ARUDO
MRAPRLVFTKESTPKLTEAGAPHAPASDEYTHARVTTSISSEPTKTTTKGPPWQSPWSQPAAAQRTAAG